MKRAFFFFIERLEISRHERIAVTVLLTSALLLSANYYLKQPVFNDDPEYYAELEAMFRQKSAELELERNAIMARYIPENPSADSLLIPFAKSVEDQGGTMIEGSENNLRSILDPERININTATVEELIALPGIGPAYARRIIEWREENGLFTKVDQLLEIRGIGEKRLANLRPYVKLGDEGQQDGEPIDM